MSSVELISKITIPRANPVKMCRVYDPGGELKNIDDRRFAETLIPGGLNQSFTQKWRRTDTNIIQFYSTFLAHTAEVLTCEEAQKFYDGEEYTHSKSLTVSQIKEFRNQFYRSDCRVVTKDGQIAIFFTEGYLYEDAIFSEVGDEFFLNGSFPGLAFPSENMVGSSVRLNIIYTPSVTSGFLDATITGISHIEGKECFILDLSLEVSEVSGQIEILYDEKDQDLYGYEMDWSGLDEGIYYIGLKAETGANEVRYLSEPQEIFIERPFNTELIEYYHSGEFRERDELGYYYEDGYSNKIRIDGHFVYMEVGGETIVYEDDRGVNTNVRSVEFTQIRMSGDHLPGYLLRILSVILSHDYKIINEYRWSKTDYGTNEVLELTDFSNFEIILRQMDDVRFQKSGETSEIVSAEFSPDVLNIPETGTIGSNHTLITDAQNVFELISKPSWVNVSENELSNGEQTVLSATENELLTERSGDVIYRAIGLPGLTASISVTQDAAEPDEPEPPEDYLYTTPSTGGNLVFAAEGETKFITVNASGPFTVLISSPYTYEIVGKRIYITAPANISGAANNGTISVILNSDNNIFSSLTLEQTNIPGITSVSPSSMSFVQSGTPVRVLTITAQAGCNWQIVSIPSWVNVSNNSGTGSATRNVFCQQNNGATTRYGTITIRNTAIPSNSFTISISQTGTGGGGGVVPVPVEP